MCHQHVPARVQSTALVATEKGSSGELCEEEALRGELGADRDDETGLFERMRLPWPIENRLST